MKALKQINCKIIVLAAILYLSISFPNKLTAQDYTFYKKQDGVEFYYRISSSSNLLVIRCSNNNTVKVTVAIANLIWLSEGLPVAKHEGSMWDFRPGETNTGGQFWTLPKGYDKNKLSFRFDDLKVHIGGYGNDARFLKPTVSDDKSLEEQLRKHPVNFDGDKKDINIKSKGSAGGVRAENNAQGQTAETLAIKNENQQSTITYLDAAKSSSNLIEKSLNLNLAEINAIASNDKTQLAEVQKTKTEVQQQQTAALIKNSADLVSGVANLFSKDESKEEKLKKRIQYDSERYLKLQEQELHRLIYSPLGETLYNEYGVSVANLEALQDAVERYKGKKGSIKDSNMVRIYQNAFSEHLINKIEKINSLDSFSSLLDTLFGGRKFSHPLLEVKPTSRYVEFIQKGANLGNLNSIVNLSVHFTYSDRDFYMAKFWLEKADTIIDQIIKKHENFFSSAGSSHLKGERYDARYYVEDIVQQKALYIRLYSGSFKEHKDVAKAINYCNEYLTFVNKVIQYAPDDIWRYKSGIKSVEELVSKLKSTQ